MTTVPTNSLQKTPRATVVQAARYQVELDHL